MWGTGEEDAETLRITATMGFSLLFRTKEAFQKKNTIRASTVGHSRCWWTIESELLGRCIVEECQCPRRNCPQSHCARVRCKPVELLGPQRVQSALLERVEERVPQHTNAQEGSVIWEAILSSICILWHSNTSITGRTKPAYRALRCSGNGVGQF
jgi:hypothetical protein